MCGANATASRRLLIFLSLMVLPPNVIAAQVFDTIFYQVAMKTHESDVKELTSAILPFLQRLDPDPPANEPRPFLVELIARTASSDREDPDREAAAMSLRRLLRIAHSEDDVFHDAIMDWIQKLIDEWDEIGLVRPEDKGNEYVPRPYDYYRGPIAKAYLETAELVLIARQETAADSPPSHYVTEILPVIDLSYERTIAKQQTSDALAAVVDYIIDRATQEVASSLLSHAGDSLRELSIVNYFPEIWESLENADLSSGLSAFLPSFRAAAARDLQNLPFEILSDQCNEPTSSDAPELRLLCEIYHVLEAIRGGTAPATAFMNLWQSTPDCSNPIYLISVIAREWHDTALYRRPYTLGGFDALSIRRDIDHKYYERMWDGIGCETPADDESLKASI